MSETTLEPCVVRDVVEDGSSAICTLALVADAVSPALLIDGTQELVEFLTTARDAGPSGAVVIDLRVPDAAPALQPIVEAFIEAAKALLHSWVLENAAGVRPANAIVSLPQQSVARRQTTEYFTSPRGQFSRGSFIDLRSSNR